MLVLLRGQYKVQLPIALARLVGFANPRCSRPFGVICFANYATHKLASQLACSQNTTDRVPKNVFEENFLGCTHRAFIPFLRTQSFHLSNSLAQSRTYSNFAYQIAEFKLGLVFFYVFTNVIGLIPQVEHTPKYIVQTACSLPEEREQQRERVQEKANM